MLRWTMYGNGWCDVGVALHGAPPRRGLERLGVCGGERLWGRIGAERAPPGPGLRFLFWGVVLHGAPPRRGLERLGVCGGSGCVGWLGMGRPRDGGWELCFGGKLERLGVWSCSV